MRVLHLLVINLLAVLPCLIGFHQTILPNCIPTSSRRCDLRSKASVVSAKSGGDERGGLKGYYVRPSRAIEKGGGFYIPGLEDNKLRVFAAAAVIALSIINTYSAASSSPNTSQLARDPTLIISTLIGIVMSGLLFAQGFLQEISSMTGNPSLSPDTALQNKQQRFFQVTEDVSENVSPILPRIAASVINAVSGVCHVSVISLPQPTLLYEISSLPLPQPPTHSLIHVFSKISVEGEKLWSYEELADVTRQLSLPSPSPDMQTILTKTTPVSNGTVLWIVGIDRDRLTMQSDLRARRSLQCLTSLLSLPLVTSDAR